MNQPKGHVLIAVTSNRPKEDEVIDAIQAAQVGLWQAGYMTTLASAGGADLEDARNQLASQFYAVKHYTDCLFLDDDVSWESGAVERLVSHPVDFVMGAYPKRAEGQGFSVQSFPGQIECVDPTTGKPHPRGLFKVAGGPAGMLRITRNVIERWVKAFPDRWYHQPKVTGGKAWEFWEFVVIDNERISEDINFCRTWRQLGGDVWVDPHIMLHHWGKKSFSGRYIDHVRQAGRLSEPSKVQKIAIAE